MKLKNISHPTNVSKTAGVAVVSVPLGHRLDIIMIFRYSMIGTNVSRGNPSLEAIALLSMRGVTGAEVSVPTLVFPSGHNVSMGSVDSRIKTSDI